MFLILVWTPLSIPFLLDPLSYPYPLMFPKDNPSADNCFTIISISARPVYFSIGINPKKLSFITISDVLE